MSAVHLHSAGKVEGFHARVDALLRPHVAGASNIRTPVADASWKKLANGTQVFFDLVASRDREFAMQNIGKECDVSPLSIDAPNWWGESRWWVSWRAVWESAGRSQFELCEIGMKFFWGPPRQRGKDQILRAEWAEPPRGGDAGQPHWHIDPWGRQPERNRLKSSADVDDIAFADIGAEKPSGFGAETGRTIDTSSLHLGMAGWTLCDMPDNPWQRQVGDDLGAVLVWTDGILGYVRRQLSRSKPMAFDRVQGSRY
jgi:hypothetical protein